jgi:NAD(P)-dependent dehydrogenase (short-subunit alcohol dehydrogenase family)
MMEESRVYVITGASGIGRATALRLVRDGARVGVVDIDSAANEAVHAAAGERADAMVTYAANVADGTAARRIIEDLLARWGRLDGLITCASASGRVAVVDMPVTEWTRVLDVNLRGTFVYCKAVVPALLARGGGAIVVTSSHLAYEGAPQATHYATAKGATESLMRSLARELGPHGIRVNALAPGPTDMSLPPSSSTLADMEARQALAASTLLSRLGTIDDHAAGIAYLLSDEASFVTGQVLHVNGGCVMP